MRACTLEVHFHCRIAGSSSRGFCGEVGGEEIGRSAENPLDGADMVGESKSIGELCICGTSGH